MINISFIVQFFCAFTLTFNAAEEQTTKNQINYYIFYKLIYDRDNVLAYKGETTNNEINGYIYELEYDQDRPKVLAYKGETTDNKINDYIYGSKYDKDQVLVYKGETTNNKINDYIYGSKYDKDQVLAYKEETTNNKINDYIYGSKYDKDQVLAYKGETTNNTINDYIYGLKYDKDQVLAYKGETIKSVRKNEGRLDETKTFIVITREIKSINNRKADIGVLTTNEHKTYPGSLLLANHNLLDNSPDIIAIGRSPLKYTINLPGLMADGSFEITPSFANYQSNLNRVLNLWFDRYPQGHINAVFQSDYTLAYSKEQLRVKFGPEFKFTDVETDVDFDLIVKQEKLIMIHRFKQIFFTVSVEAPNEPANLFASNVTLDQVSRKMNSENPPLLVDSVSYGRVIYVKIETSSTDDYAKYILLNKINRFDLNDTGEYIKQLKNFNMQVYVMGGGTEHIDLITAKTVEEVNKIIVEHGKFDKTNLGFPLSYASLFLKDNSFAIVRASTDYTESRRTEYQKGIIKLKHRGWYVAKWVVGWDERSYDNNGNEIRNRKGWEKNYDDITAPFEREIELGGNCDNIYVLALDKTGLLWEPLRTVIERSGIPLINYRTFSIWGTTLFPAKDIYPSI